VGGLGLGLGTIVRDEKWAGMKVTELIPGRCVSCLWHCNPKIHADVSYCDYDDT